MRIFHRVVLGSILGICCGLLVGWAAETFGQTKNVVFDSSALVIKSVTITPLPGGTYILGVCASVESGGTALDSCESTLVTRGANLASMLDIVTQARTYWLGKQSFIPDGGKL